MARSGHTSDHHQHQHHRRQSAHSSSYTAIEAALPANSAFSSNAQPHEDWTKITDLAERRRIQNRIAQRNYRKKLKRRLEDLERKASGTSPSASPEPSTSNTSLDDRHASRSPSQQQSPSTQAVLETIDSWDMSTHEPLQLYAASPDPLCFPVLSKGQQSPPPQFFSPLVVMPNSTYHSNTYQPIDEVFQLETPHVWKDDRPYPFRQDIMYSQVAEDLNLPTMVSAPHFDLPYHDPTLTDASLTPELCDMYDLSSPDSPELGMLPLTPLLDQHSPSCCMFDQL